MSLPEIILLRNQERLREKAVEALKKAKAIKEITEAVHLLKLEIQEEKEALADLMNKMKNLASTLDEAGSDGSSQLQAALRDASAVLGEEDLRLHSEIGSMLTKGAGSEGADRDAVPGGMVRREVVVKPGSNASAEQGASLEKADAE